MEHTKEGVHVLDLAMGLWAGGGTSEEGDSTPAEWSAHVDVMVAEGCICESEQLTGVWDKHLIASLSSSGLKTVWEDVETVDESGAATQPVALS